MNHSQAQPNQMVIECEVGLRMWGKATHLMWWGFRLWVSESESEVAGCEVAGWKWEWGFRLWVSESENEVAGCDVGS